MSTRSLRDHERGSATLFVAVAVFALFVMVGFVVDAGGKVRATQQADQIAREAARQAGQALDAADLMQGKVAEVDPAKARAAAEAYLAAAGVTGSVSVSGTTIRVSVTTTYRPVFLSIIGLGSMQVEGVAETRSVRALNGEER